MTDFLFLGDFDASKAESSLEIGDQGTSIDPGYEVRETYEKAMVDGQVTFLATLPSWVTAVFVAEEFDEETAVFYSQIVAGFDFYDALTRMKCMKICLVRLLSRVDFFYCLNDIQDSDPLDMVGGQGFDFFRDWTFGASTWMMSSWDHHADEVVAVSG